MRWGLFALALAAGVGNAVQNGTNTRLNKAFDAPGWSVAWVGLVLMLSGVVYALVSRARLPSAAMAADGPWWMWVGGVCGALFVLSALLVASKVGAGTFVGLTVTASVITALVLDHFGLLGIPVHPAGWGRVAGGALMVAGLGLIAKF